MGALIELMRTAVDDEFSSTDDNADSEDDEGGDRGTNDCINGQSHHNNTDSNNRCRNGKTAKINVANSSHNGKGDL